MRGHLVLAEPLGQLPRGALGHPAGVDEHERGKVVRAVEQTTYVGELRITSATRLMGDLGLGRFDFLKLAIYLEEAFDIELPDEAIKAFVTVGDIVKYLSRRYFRDVEFPQLAMVT
jgi:acyl carrier protein